MSRETIKPYIIRPSKLAKMIDVHLSTIYRWEDEGEMPISKIRLAKGTVGYRRKDIEDWLGITI